MPVDNVGNFSVIQYKNSYNIQSTNIPFVNRSFSMCFIILLTDVKVCY